MNLDKVNLNLFVALAAVLESRNLTEAAKRLHLSQPALSVSLRKLRELYNDELVLYAGGEATLTPLGQALKPRVSFLLQTAKDALKTRITFDPSEASQTFRIVAPDVLELLFLKGVFASALAEAPGIRLVSQPFTYRPMDQIMRDDVDIVIVSDVFASDRYSREELFTESFSCMVWEGNTEVGDTLTPEQYLALDHADLAFTPEHVSHSPVFDALSKLRDKRRVALRAGVYSSLPHLVVGTPLIVTTLTRYARWCVERLPLRMIPYPFPMPPLTYVAQWQPYRDEEPALVWMRGKLREAAAALDSPVSSTPPEAPARRRPAHR